MQSYLSQWQFPDQEAHMKGLTFLLNMLKGIANQTSLKVSRSSTDL